MKSSEKWVKSSFSSIKMVFFLLLLPNISVAYDNYYLFEQGFRAKRLGDYEQAITSYEKYIDGNPFTDDYSFSSQDDVGNRQFYLRNLIIAYGNLLKIYSGVEKNKGEVNKRLNELKQLHRFGRLGSKNAYKIALIMRDNNDKSFSADIYEKIILDQEDEFRDGNEKVVLRSYKKLLNYRQSIGEKDKVETLLSKMMLNYPSQNSDSKDRCELADILLKYNNSQEAASLFEGVIQDYINSNSSADPDPAVRAIQKLVRLYAKTNEQDSLELLEAKIEKNINLENISTGRQYKIASTLVNYANSNIGKHILKNIVSNRPETEEAKKALFILGRNSLISEEWNNAIDYYSTYVKRYPENTFFALKAYSKLLDAHFSKDGYSDFLQSKTQALSEVVNGVSDYETILNLSRDIHRKGWADLSYSTFEIGMEKAQKYLEEEEGTINELRARWIIEKYAYGLELPDIVEENAHRIFELTDILSSSNMTLAEKDKMKFIKGDTHLWLAQIAKDKSDISEAEIQLKIFIEENPASDDSSYAWYQLGEIYQEKGLMEKAENCFSKVTEGIWKEKRKTLMGITDDQ